MPENFAVAAERHLRVGELLFKAEEYDDAGYHFGVCGEILVKHALREAGVEREWILSGAALGKSPKKTLLSTPMRRHLPELTSVMPNFQTEIALYMSGRFSPAVTSLILVPSFIARFGGWHIDIRYADPLYTPVDRATCQRWYDDATDFFLGLAI
jgi:hypothetical protein